MNEIKNTVNGNIMEDELFLQAFEIFGMPKSLKNENNELENLAYFETEDLRIDMNDPDKNPEGITAIKVTIEYEDEEVAEMTYVGEPMKDIKAAKSAYDILHHEIWLQRFSDTTFEVHVELKTSRGNLDYYANVTIEELIYKEEEPYEELQKVG